MLTQPVRNSKTPECGHRQQPPGSLPSSARPRLLDLSWEIRRIQPNTQCHQGPSNTHGNWAAPSPELLSLSVHWVQPLAGEKPCLQVLLHPTSQQSQVSSPVPAAALLGLILKPSLSPTRRGSTWRMQQPGVVELAPRAWELGPRLLCRQALL